MPINLYGGDMLRRLPLLATALAAAGLLLVACGSAGSTGSAGSAGSTAVASGVEHAAAPVLEASGARRARIVNHWSGAKVDPTALPIGDSRVSTATARRGGLWACTAGIPGGPGAFADGPWMDSEAGTYDSTTKVQVSGALTWPTARYGEKVVGGTRVLTSSGLPTKQVTGTFPIPETDEAFQYDHNPNHIEEHDVTLRLPASPTKAGAPSCLRQGSIGMFRNGVVFFAPLDAANRDAVAHELQDVCDGHPEMTSVYHYHDVPVCLRDAATGPSSVVGFAADGFPVVVERDPKGRLPTNADLDRCHGRTSPIRLDGKVVTRYHYSATLEFPYLIGCFRGTPR